MNPKTSDKNPGVWNIVLALLGEGFMRYVGEAVREEKDREQYNDFIDGMAKAFKALGPQGASDGLSLLMRLGSGFLQGEGFTRARRVGVTPEDMAGFLGQLELWDLRCTECYRFYSSNCATAKHKSGDACVWPACKGTLQYSGAGVDLTNPDFYCDVCSSHYFIKLGSFASEPCTMTNCTGILRRMPKDENRGKPDDAPESH